MSRSIPVTLALRRALHSQYVAGFRAERGAGSLSSTVIEPSRRSKAARCMGQKHQSGWIGASALDLAMTRHQVWRVKDIQGEDAVLQHRPLGKSENVDAISGYLQVPKSSLASSIRVVEFLQHSLLGLGWKILIFDTSCSFPS